ncbi:MULTISPECIES: FHA domain-containing protein [Peptoniphilus]|uniref:FHA domain-containing protein n=1 Tax=Peptoniphilus harei TaxID=54005 RepID=A0A943SNV8_9FIRM|nr:MULTISPECIES: FHA domain-containing protein [Peptoniphilus]MBS6534411.1 FHA domain-containing protein [Peptoniphilus harei]MDU1177131.1 FHA domain-containing protein [Peptoniphilus harei]MDU1642959.1 FHA domain-containing protein [Peptoniphilus harei]MDU5470467.1 FHA domain-containing protein [Peptoniphilus harei]OFO60152.1 FHA domain-containing protein [Peptoniphilus sp. HMSC075B08]
MFELISQVLRYVFIILIYLFIFSILRLMYLDVKSITSGGGSLDDAYLKVVNRLDSLNFKMQEYYVIDGDISLGRSSKNDVVIKDKFVSKNHLLIREKNQRYYLEDLGSANGTFLNGVKIDPNELIELQNNDKIGVGFIQFIFVDKR